MNAPPVRVLVVDDEPDICFLLSSLLQRQGLMCTSAHTLASARELLGAGAFDVVFLDIYLPDGRGYTTLAESIHRSGAKIVAMSAVDNEREHAMRHGVDLFIAKPFEQRAILTGLHELGLIP
ncbi:MAG: response regulator [Flavobacteriales bacterium]|nr:response regulator [Flavobacteriales bacterium]